MGEAGVRGACGAGDPPSVRVRCVCVKEVCVKMRYRATPCRRHHAVALSDDTPALRSIIFRDAPVAVHSATPRTVRSTARPAPPTVRRTYPLIRFHVRDLLLYPPRRLLAVFMFA